MNRTILITIICTLAVVLLIGIVIALIVGATMEPKHWSEQLEGSVSLRGEIVEIIPRDGGYQLSVIKDSGEAVELWVYENSQCNGSFVGMDFQTMLEKKIAGAYISAETYASMDNIIDGWRLLPAKSITVIDE